MSLQDLRDCQLLDDVERRAEVKTLSEALRRDDGQRLALASAALGDESINDDFQLCMDILTALGSDSDAVGRRPSPRGSPITDLALCLSDSVFPPVRVAAASSGLLSDEDALLTLLNGRSDLAKPLLRARAVGRYGFHYAPVVGEAIERVYGARRSGLMKVLAGADLVATFRGGKSPPAAGDMAVLARRLPPHQLIELVREVDGLLTAEWLKILLRRCEDLDPEGEAKAVAEALAWVLYREKKWHPDVNDAKEEAEAALKYLWRRQGPATTKALASYNPENDPVLSLDDVLRLSKHTSWDQQIEAFRLAKDRLGGTTDDDDNALPLEYIRVINKSFRSRHCRKLLDLLTAITATPRVLVDALDGMIARGQLPPVALSGFVAPTLIEAAAEDGDLLVRAFEIGRILLERPRRPRNDESRAGTQESKERRKGPPPPYVEYMDDAARLKLFAGVVSHERARDVLNGDALGRILRAFAKECADLATLREGAALFVRILGESVRPEMLVDVASAMARVDAARLDAGDAASSSSKNSCEGLPFEFLEHLCKADDPNGALLLDHVADESASTGLVTRFGRSAWWDLLLYGLGGPLPRPSTVKPPKITSGAVPGSSGKYADDFVVVESAENQRKPDEFFASDLLNDCTGRDLERRRDGLRQVLDSCHHTTEFRLRRLAYAIRRVAAEPDHTKQALVPTIFRTIRGAKEWVQLSTELSVLWDKCVASTSLADNLTPSFLELAKETCSKVIEGALPVQSTGAQLAVAVVEHNDRDWIVEQIEEGVYATEYSSETLEFLLAAALRSCEDVISLILTIVDWADYLDPKQLLDKEWAAPLREKLVQCCNDPEFLLVDALKSLAENDVESGWTPCKDDTVKAAVAALETSDDIPAVISLLLRHLEALGNYQEELELPTDILARTKVATGDAGSALVSVFKRSEESDDTFAACVGVLFSSKRIAAWEEVVPKPVALALSEAAAERRVFKLDVDRETSECILNVWHKSSDGTASAKIVARSDAIDAVVISYTVARDLVLLRPALLRDVVRAFPPKTKPIVRKWEALSKTLETLLEEKHLPSPTAVELADTMKAVPGAKSTLCLARLLREVDLTETLLERVRAIEGVQEVTDIVKAASEAGHPQRAAELILRGTNIKEQSHRTSLERSLAELPVEKTQTMIEGILSNKSTNPAVVKICLRLFETVQIREPERLMLVAWRNGQCHPDVDVHIKAMYASSAKYSPDYQDLLFDSTKIADKTRLSFVVRELIEILRGTSWSSAPLIRFLSTAIDEGAVKANSVFSFIVDRMRLSAAFEAVDAAVVFLTELILRGRSLSDSRLHGMDSVASDWIQCSSDFYELYMDPFVFSLKQVKDQSTKQKFVLALAGSQPASTRLLSVWAQVFLAGEMEGGEASNIVDLGFRLTRGENESLLQLCKAAVSQATTSPSKEIIAAALMVNKRTYGKVQCHSEFTVNSASLAALSADKDSLISQYEAAAALDIAEEKERHGEGGKHLHLTDVVQSVAGLSGLDDIYLQTLQWMKLKSEIILSCDALVSTATRLAIQTIQVKPSHAKEVTVAMLAFRDHDKLEGFENVLLGFDRAAMLLWVKECVRLHEMAAGSETLTLPKPPLFRDASMRAGAADVLATSSFSHFRLRSLGFLPLERVKIAAEHDEDYSVRTIAQLLIKRATDQRKLGIGGNRTS